MDVVVGYNKVAGCSYSSDVVVQESMDYSCFVEESERELLQLKQLIVCGKLRGELPAGFLSCFRHLPNELIIKIWSYLSARELRSLRLVSKHWKSLWEEHVKNRRKAITKLSIALDEDSGKLVLKAVANSYFGRQVDVPNIEENIQQAFSLITFPVVPDLFCINCLLLYGKAANEKVLQLIIKQDWVIHTVVFEGDLRNLTEENLCTFLQANAYLSTGVISDNIIEACSAKLMEFVIDLDHACMKNQPIALTDQCLPYLIRDEVLTIIPSYSTITVSGIAVALKAFFFRKNYVTNAISFFTTRAHNARLCLGLSEAVTAKKIGAIRVIANQILINQCYHSSNSRVECSMEVKNMKDVGVIEFTYKREGDKHKECSDTRRFYIEIADEVKIREYIDSSTIRDVIVHLTPLDSGKLSSSIEYPSDVSDFYGYSISENQSVDYEYSGYGDDQLIYGDDFSWIFF
uniref:F-box domain-containing protein n=1 Tax=Elaeophora elaphi TaxID=1147741 RepID=A0A0R3RZU5_9BILA